MKATFFKYQLQFKQASGTSRGVLTSKDTWFLKIQDANQMGIGECGMFRGLSCDDRPDFADKLDWVCENIKLGQEALLEELLCLIAPISIETISAFLKAGSIFSNSFAFPNLQVSKKRESNSLISS